MGVDRGYEKSRGVRVSGEEQSCGIVGLTSSSPNADRWLDVLASVVSILFVTEIGTNSLWHARSVVLPRPALEFIH